MINIKIGGFEPQSKFSKSLIPLLDALKWNGSNIDLIESLVDNPSNMDEDGLIETLANLKYQSFVYKQKKINSKTSFYPYLAIGKTFIYLILRVKENSYLIYDCNDSQYKTVKNIGSIKRIIHFTQLEADDFSLLKPQKNWFFQLLSRFKREFSYVLIVSLLITLTSFITPLFIMLINSQVRTSQKWENIAFLGIATFVFILGTAGFKYLRNYLLVYIGSRVGYLVNKEINRRLLYLPPKYSETASVSAQLNRIRDFESITEFLSGNAITSIIDIPLSILMMIGLVFISGYVVFVPIIAYILMLILGFFAYKTYINVNDRDVEKFNKKNKLQHEMLSKMSFIRITGNQERWFKEYDKRFADAAYSTFNSSNFLLIINTLFNAVVNITLILTIAICVLRVLEGDMTSGALFTTFIITGRILAPLKSGFNTISQFSKIKKSINQLNKFMSLKVEDRPITVRPINNQMYGAINFNNIFLKYGSEVSPALVNIKYSQNPGDFTVFTGHGGSGKSSIIKMLLALYEPISGSIYYDKTNIMQLDRLQLRKSVCYLPAEPYLFPGTIKFNLYLAKPDATDLQIDTVLERVNILDNIKTLPSGLDTNVQDLPPKYRKDAFVKRINLAMMLIRDFPIYLIDNLESGLESSDYDFFKNILEQVKGESTVILTTNIKEFIALGDQVITLDSGRIVKVTNGAKI